MPPPQRNWRLWGKMFAVGTAICVGGPALTLWLTPTEEELFLKYNPELQKRSLENRQKKQEDFDGFVTRLKEYSKDSRSIWEVQAEAESKLRKEGKKIAEDKLAADMQVRKESMRAETGPLVPGGSL